MPTHSNQTIIVTGAATGMGTTTALALASQGYHVIAGILTTAEAKQFTSPNIEPFILDVTNSEDISRLVNHLQNDPHKRKIRALINNAGIEFNAPFEELPLPEWRKQFEVNFFGAIALTQKILPFLRQSRGTVVNITSVGGKVALPNYAPYAASKFALEGASDALRREVRSQGIKVVVVEPGGIQTEMAAHSGDLSLAFIDQLSPEAKQRYQQMITAAVGSQSAFLKYAMPADKAGNRIAQIATKPHPRPRYLLGTDAHFSVPLSKWMPTRLMDWMLTFNGNR